MDTTKVCEHCGKPLGSKAVHGLCPECFLKVGLGSGAAPEAGAPKPNGFVPPKAEELAAHFPQLEILELLGKGGMGAVYKARQKGLDRLVALKVLPPDPGRDPAFAERFTREAQALARLSHPNIVTVHEFGQAGGFYFFVMEFVDGVNLRQMLRAQRLSPREAMAIVPQICEGLQYAHDQGIVHRDIKPENVLVDRQGRVKIADFGLAKLLGKDPQGEPLTRSAEVMGTPQYMAPEQLEKPLEVDHRADIYSLGVVFYEMLTGELPLGRFAAPSKKVQIDVRLDEIVLRALEKEPGLRYQQASVFKTQVETLAAGPAPIGPPPKVQPEPEPVPASEPTGFSARLVPWQIWVAVALLAMEAPGLILSIPRQPQALYLVAVKCLFIVGLLLRGRTIYVLSMIVTAIHVVFFAAHAPWVAFVNLILLGLMGSAFRYYFNGRPLRWKPFVVTGVILLIVTALLVPVLGGLWLYRSQAASKDKRRAIVTELENDRIQMLREQGARQAGASNLNRLAEALSQRDELSTKYTDQHPKVRNLQAEIDSLNKQILTTQAFQAGLTSRTFTLRHKLASDMVDDLRSVLSGRPGQAMAAADNVQLIVAAPPEVMSRVATFITVQDWPSGGVVRGPECAYRRDTVENAARAFFYACSTEDYDCVAGMLSPNVLANLKGTNLNAFRMLEDNPADANLVRQLRGNWDGKDAAVRQLVRSWNRFPLRQVRERGGVAMGFGARYFAFTSFEGAPADFVELSFVRDGDGTANNALVIDTLPPWPPAVESQRSATTAPSDLNGAGDAILQTTRDILAADTEAKKRDLNARFEAASHVTAFNERDTAMASVAREAARAGNATLAKRAVAGITSFPVRDDAARDAARELAKVGQRTEAVEIARSITSFAKRDAALRELAQ